MTQTSESALKTERRPIHLSARRGYGSSLAGLASMIAASQSKAADTPRDGDGDDVAATPVQAAPAPGTGQAVDKTA